MDFAGYLLLVIPNQVQASPTPVPKDTDCNECHCFLSFWFLNVHLMGSTSMSSQGGQ